MFFGGNLEKRKLIKFGKNSYVISLPRDWIDENNLLRENTVFLQRNGPELLVTSESNLSEKKFDYLIDCKDKDILSIKRQIYAAYINNCSILTIKDLSDEKIVVIKKILENLFAFQIIKQSNDKIVLKDYLNIHDIKIVDVIRRIDNLIRNMFTESIEAIKIRKVIEISSIDKDVNKLAYLALKVIKMCINDSYASKILNLSKSESLLLWEMIARLENIADSIKRISRLDMQIDDKSLNDICIHYEYLKYIFIEVMKGYYSKDVSILNNMVKDEDNYRRKLFELNSISKNINHTLAVESLFNIQESIKNISRAIF